MILAEEFEPPLLKARRYLSGEGDEMDELEKKILVAQARKLRESMIVRQSLQKQGMDLPGIRIAKPEGY